MMISATPGQKLLIDGRRHEQCKHPPAHQLDALECLFCKRCGVEFVEGKLEFTEPLLEEHEKPGEFHASSYMARERGDYLYVGLASEKQESRGT